MNNNQNINLILTFSHLSLLFIIFNMQRNYQKDMESLGYCRSIIASFAPIFYNVRHLFTPTLAVDRRHWDQFSRQGNVQSIRFGFNDPSPGFIEVRGLLVKNNRSIRRALNRFRPSKFSQMNIKNQMVQLLKSENRANFVVLADDTLVDNAQSLNMFKAGLEGMVLEDVKRVYDDSRASESNNILICVSMKNIQKYQAQRQPIRCCEVVFQFKQILAQFTQHQDFINGIKALAAQYERFMDYQEDYQNTGTIALKVFTKYNPDLIAESHLPIRIKKNLKNGLIQIWEIISSQLVENEARMTSEEGYKMYQN